MKGIRKGAAEAVRGGRRYFKREVDDAQLAATLKEETSPPPIKMGVFDKSIVKTMHFQKSLPRLPIPTLEDTCKNYVKSVTPLLTDSELKKTESIVASFAAGEGKQLHDQLLAKDKMNKHTSFISQDWYDMYLSARTPLPLNWNPFLVFRADPVAERNSQAYRTATFIRASLDFRQKLENGELAPEVFHLNPKVTKAEWFQRLASMAPQSIASYVSIIAKGYPLDMSQFPRLFNTTRVPELMKDRLVSGKGDHVVVFYKGAPFKVNVCDAKGSPLDVDQIAARLTKLTFDMAVERAEYPIGALTAAERNTWARAREELLLDETNKETFNTIDSALFTICFDDDVVDFEGTDRVTEMARLFLHGDPQKGNRWWDKSMSLLVSRNGTVCCNFEHSWGDGVAVMRWANDVFHAAAESRALPKPVKATELPEPLPINLTPSTKNAITEAIASYQSTVDRLDYKVSVHPGLGKKKLKTMAVSPDAFIQQAFQLAFKRMYNETRSTYESASTSGFRHGRTEAIRAATIESKAFCDSMAGEASTTARRENLYAAMKRHEAITREALTGKGMDRHLFALKKIAERSGGSVPEIFADRGYAVLNENIISTSTLYSDTLCLGGFGPVHGEGFGLGYSVTPNLLFLAATSYTRDCSAYCDAVWDAVDEMKWLIENK